MPNVSSAGSSFLSSRTTSDACRSPDASPATMASFISVRRRVHQPADGDRPEEQRAEYDEKGPDAVAFRFAPQQGEEESGRHRVKEHERDVGAEEAHADLPMGVGG